MPKKWDILSLPKDKRWDMSLWPDSEIRQWQYAIGARSDSVISEAMDTDDWSDHDADERTYKKLEAERMKRGSFWGYHE